MLRVHGMIHLRSINRGRVHRVEQRMEDLIVRMQLRHVSSEESLKSEKNPRPENVPFLFPPEAQCCFFISRC